MWLKGSDDSGLYYSSQYFMKNISYRIKMEIMLDGENMNMKNLLLKVILENGSLVDNRRKPSFDL